MDASALLNLPLNLMLIRRFHAMGAASATLLSFAVLALATFKLSERGYSILYEYGRLATLLVAGVVVFAVSKPSNRAVEREVPGPRSEL
ncbi:MAG: polysaccharide biosynthesis C-terminal domain-containing protein [Burkholderiales bacterium]